MQVFITSSPFVPDADGPIFSNDNGFVDNLREVLPPFPKCLFVASDPERHDLTCQWGTDMITAMAGQGIYSGGFAVLDGSNAEMAEQLVAESDFICLAGGHVPTQNAFFQEIGLRELLQDWDGTVMGISAGSMNTADVVYIQPEEPGESDLDFARFAPGLGLTEVNVLPHYQKVKDTILDGQRLFEDITYADSYGHEFFALVDGSYFYQDEEKLLLCGEGYRLKDGIMERLTWPGEILDMAELG